jgi:hypothetical protein
MGYRVHRTARGHEGDDYHNPRCQCTHTCTHYAFPCTNRLPQIFQRESDRLRLCTTRWPCPTCPLALHSRLGHQCLEASSGSVWMFIPTESPMDASFSRFPGLLSTSA